MWHGDPACGQAGGEEEGAHLLRLPADVHAGAPHQGCSGRLMDITPYLHSAQGVEKG